MTYPFFGSEGKAEFLAPFTPEDVCVDGQDGCGPDQQVDQLGTTEPKTQERNDAALAANLQRQELEEARASDSGPIASGQDSLRRTRTDNDMKELLKTLQVPHYVRKSRTHGQNNCLIDSILLALQEQKQIKPLGVDDRAAVCSSVRRGLIDHHGVAPGSPEEGQTYLSHEESFDDICTRLRVDHPDIWFDGIDPHRLPIIAVVFDRSQRQQIYDTSDELAGEVPDDLNEPVESKALITSDNLPEVCIRLYCNTHDDAHCTPYHYEWISCRDKGDSEDEKSNVDDDDDVESNPDPLPLATSDENDDDNEDEDDDVDNPAPPSQRTPMSDTDDDDNDEGDTAPCLPLAESSEDSPPLPPPPAPPPSVAGVECEDQDGAVSPVPEMTLRTQLSTHFARSRSCICFAFSIIIVNKKSARHRTINKVVARACVCVCCLSSEGVVETNSKRESRQNNERA